VRKEEVGFHFSKIHILRKTQFYLSDINNIITKASHYNRPGRQPQKSVAQSSQVNYIDLTEINAIDPMLHTEVKDAPQHGQLVNLPTSGWGHDSRLY
jgi:hypothetical protein